MVAYQDFVSLSQSGDSEERGQAAHLAARAYLGHSGPADEHAALYAALIGFLDDPSVKVRAALAYGLLHAYEAPRPILLALVQDSAVISRAVVQYSPALIDADLIGLVREGDPQMLHAVALREHISARLAEALIEQGDRPVTLALLRRLEVPVPVGVLDRLAEELGLADAHIRGALLNRKDLPAASRLALVEASAKALRGARLVKGAIAPKRLDRLLRDAADTALTCIGETASIQGGQGYAEALVKSQRLSSRIMLHALVNGQVMFFADCLATLSQAPAAKVFALLESGSRPVLNALLARCGIGDGVRNLIVRLVYLARNADLADDVTARHFVVTVLTEELIAEHRGNIPPELEEAFGYLSEQNVALARRAARGVMSSFAQGEGERTLPAMHSEPQLVLPAA